MLYYIILYIYYIAEKPKQGGWAEDMEFQGVLKKKHAEIQGVS